MEGFILLINKFKEFHMAIQATLFGQSNMLVLGITDDGSNLSMEEFVGDEGSHENPNQGHFEL
jgi:hypothetical protein